MVARKITVSLVLGALILGGVTFGYFNKEKAETVFENPVDTKVSLETTTVHEPEEVEKIETQEAPKSAVAEEETTPQEAAKESVPETKPEIGNEPKGFSIKSNLVSFGHESTSGRKIDTIVLHSSYSPSGDPYSVSAVMGIWKGYGVAPHYMVARDGTVYQLVSDKDIAYHAGESQMKDGRKNVNDFSLGVEILNTKDDEYTKAQYQAVKDLVSYLKGKHAIKYVVGHDDIAPGRKTDPWNFDWNKI